MSGVCVCVLVVVVHHLVVSPSLLLRRLVRCSSSGQAARKPRRGPAASEDRQAPGTSCQARCFSVLRSPLFPIRFLCLPSRCGCRCACSPVGATASYSSHLKPPKTLPRLLSSHTPFAWSPAPTRVFDDWAILPRSCSYKSLWPCFIPTVLLFLCFFPRKTKPPTDRPTDDRTRPGFACRKDHEMKADGAFA